MLSASKLTFYFRKLTNNCLLLWNIWDGLSSFLFPYLCVCRCGLYAYMFTCVCVWKAHMYINIEAHEECWEPSLITLHLILWCRNSQSNPALVRSVLLWLAGSGRLLCLPSTNLTLMCIRGIGTPVSLLMLWAWSHLPPQPFGTFLDLQIYPLCICY